MVHPRVAVLLGVSPSLVAPRGSRHELLPVSARRHATPSPPATSLVAPVSSPAASAKMTWLELMLREDWSVVGEEGRIKVEGPSGRGSSSGIPGSCGRGANDSRISRKVRLLKKKGLDEYK